MTRMMQGYESDGSKFSSSYHGDPHPYDNVCDSHPKCREIVATALAEGPNTVTHNANEPAWKTPPEHYATGSGIQPWDIWDSFGLDKDAYLANATKYILRAGKKPGEERLKDLRKAANYIAKAIDREESRE